MFMLTQRLVLHQVSICFRSETVILLWPLEPSHAGPLSGKLGMDLGDNSGSAWPKWMWQAGDVHLEHFRTYQFNYILCLKLHKVGFKKKTNGPAMIWMLMTMLCYLSAILILEENGWNFIFRIHLQPASLVWAALARCKSRCSNEALVAGAGWMPLASPAMAGSLPLPNPWRPKPWFQQQMHQKCQRINC